MKIRFLLDENLSPQLTIAVLNLNSAIDILRVGDSNTPPLATPDPDILVYLELSQRLLVTNNRKSMPGHLQAHWENERHIWGLLWLRSEVTLGRLAAELWMIWETSEAEEWIDKTDWIPF